MASRPNPQQPPFYIQVTPLKIDYLDYFKTPKTKDLPLITLPPGTVLFRGLRIPNPAAGEDVRYFYRDFLGDPEGSDYVCLKPTHNVFFYPVPYVAFGADTIGKTFHSMQAVVLVNPITVVCNISPAKMVRSDAYGFQSSTFPYKRCDDPTFTSHCHEPTEKELEALRYDNCLDPKFQQESGVRGWMAIADRDSIKPTKVDPSLKYALRRQGILKATAQHSPMGKYILNLEKKQPGLGPLALAWMYGDLREEDRRAHAGFPEIALYPYRVHPGDRLVKRKCATQEHALNLMEREAALNNLNYLPLAAFTETGTVDMVNGHFSYECLGVSERTFAIPAQDQQGTIETRLREWMDYCQIKGLNLPFYGHGKLSFDMRTGFYVFPQMLPKNIRLRLPEPDAKGRTDMPYEYLALPLDTEEAKKRVLTYMLMFRSFIPSEYMKMFPLLKMFGVPRAMVLNRPPALNWIFKELGIDIPKDFIQILGRAATQYKANTGAKSKKDMEAEAAAARELAIAIQNVVKAAPQNNSSMGNAIFFLLYNNSGEIAAQFSFEQWRAMRDPGYLKILKLAGREPSQAEKSEKQYKLKMNVNLTPQAKAPPSSPVTNMKEEANIPEDVIGKREYLFGAQIPERDLKFIQLDETALYSVTDGRTAIQQTKRIKEKLETLVGEGRAADCIVTDGTANVGGNTISFGKEFKFVNSVEISPLRASLLANNIMIATTQNNTTVHVADYTKIWNKLKQNVIFIDPPWGGVGYKTVKVLDMFLGTTNVIDLIKEMVDAKAANLIAMKAPINYNIEGLKAKLVGITPEMILMKKQILILIPVTKDIEPLGTVSTTPPAYMGSTPPAYMASTPPLYISSTPPLYGSTPVLGPSTPVPAVFSPLPGAVTPVVGALTPVPGGESAIAPAQIPKSSISAQEPANIDLRTFPPEALKYYEDSKREIRDAEINGRTPIPPPIPKGKFTPSRPNRYFFSAYDYAKIFDLAKTSTSPLADINYKITPPGQQRVISSSPLNQIAEANVNLTNMSPDESSFYKKYKQMIQEAREKGEDIPSPPLAFGLENHIVAKLANLARSSSSPPTSGGRRNKTRTKKSKRNQTRKARKNNSPIDFAKAFSRVWGAHGRNQ